MSTREQTIPIYWRSGRAYLDARSYSDVGGGQERLVAPGEVLATNDRVIALQLASKRIAELEARRRQKALHGVALFGTLETFAAHHLMQKAREERITEEWLAQNELHLRYAVAFFGDCALLDITPVRVQEYAAWLAEPGRTARAIGPGSRRKYLNSLSNMFRRAISLGYVPLGYNPVTALMDKPQAAHHEAEWLEVHEASLLLEAARRYEPDRSDGIPPEMLHAIIAAFLLTGGREKEVLGLEVSDVSMTRGTITFRPNRWRRLKTRTSHRVLPLWPQLEDILRSYLASREGKLGDLLFPSPRAESEAMIRDIRKAIDAAAMLAGWQAGDIRTKALRHSYCAARLQTTDRGAAVAEYTVSREMGHGGPQLVRRVYGHLGVIRHRAEVVEYRVEQHMDELRHRIDRLPPSK